ncbi:hypothetical protein N7448_002804 [Penicillium atrosanguineum]|nr:hypothetical protein N7448_002804 [Penicillium atrosanguineum]
MNQYYGSDWDTGDMEGLVSIGSHKLYLSASGPERLAGEPIVLLMQGLGSTIDEWVAVRKLMLPFARWLNYDRSGMGRSESLAQMPESISAESVAAELDTLLKNAGIALSVHHRRTFLGRHNFAPNDIVGMVFVDCNTESYFDDGTWGLEVFEPMMGGQDFSQTTGLATSHLLSKDEWKSFYNEQMNERHQKTEMAEYQGVKTSGRALAQKRQLENLPLNNQPVSVIIADTSSDFQRIYDCGVAAGKGTEEERAVYLTHLARLREKSEDWQCELLKLSRRSRAVRVKCGHNVQMLQPQPIVQEI